MTALIQVDRLSKNFPVHAGLLRREAGAVQAVSNISLDIHRGETLGLVGESGCGKSTLGRLVIRLLEPTSGTVRFNGDDLTHASREQLRKLRRRMQIIFQDPYSSLDPRSPVGNSIAEGLRVHGITNQSEQHEKVGQILDRVGLQSAHAQRFPHEFSGVQRQRIGIARALVLQPDFVVCDEPVSALDVSVQAQVLNLLRQLQRELELTLLFISHNLAVVEHLSDRVAVMYLGEIVEITDRDTLYREAQHPYTKALLSAVPVPNPHLRGQKIILQGDVPSPLNPPPGCKFHPRCPIAMDACRTTAPTPIQMRRPVEHLVACHAAG